MYDVDYDPLTDAEWAAVEQLMEKKIAETYEPKNVGRPRANTRELVNAVVQSIAFGCSVAHVTHTLIRYPSPPTCRRFMKTLTSSGAIDTVISVLSSTRPHLEQQWINKPPVLVNGHENGAPTKWGFELSHLPFWGAPAFVGDDGDGGY